METNKLCEWCDNTGITTMADGPDDFITDYCSCPEGSIKMKNAEIQVMLQGLYKKMTV